ncbi:MAG: ATP-binding protein [candidate division WOR-3 bacterium]
MKFLESKKVDFKENFGESVLKTLCAFANTDGGEVVIGVNNEGEIIGFSFDNETLREITEKIVTKLGIHPDISLEREKGKPILRIKVNKSNIPISYNGKYYERIGNTTREMNSGRLKDFFLRTKSWDTMITEGARFEDIDKESVKKFIRIARENGRLTIFDENSNIKNIFEHLKLSNKGKLTNAAIILFGKNPQRYFINAVTRIVRLKNETTIIGDRLIEGNLFKQVVEAEEAIKNFLGVRYEIKGLIRKEKWDYPITAIREALINALIHRDYFKWNVQTQIKIFDDYLWFFNIGGLPEGITLEQLKKPHSSVPRNPLIVHIFYLSGLIEEVGSGIGRIIQDIKFAKLPEPEFKEEMGGFSVYFRKDIYTEEYLRKLGLNERQVRAVIYVKEKGKITNREYQEINGCHRNTATQDLSDLVEKGILKESGKKGAGAHYEIAQ